MNYALDGILVLVVLVFVLIGVRRGFVRSAAHFLGAVLAALLAAALGGMAAQWLFDSFFRQSLVEKVQETISTLGGGDVGVAASGFFASLPDFVQRVLESAGITASPSPRGWTPKRARPPSWWRTPCPRCLWAF